MEYYAIKVDNKTFDIFEGTQYHPDFWTRLRGGRFGVYVQKGRSLPKPLVKQLASLINPTQERQFLNVEM